MIELDEIVVELDGRIILDKVSCSFKSGELNLIIGKSGSGKSVLLKTILGIFPLKSGEIYYDGQPFSKLNKNNIQKLRKEIGMVFQAGALFDSLTVGENLLFPLEMFTNSSKKEKYKRILTYLEKVNLRNTQDKMPSELSGGMQKRVAIARAIILNPKYLFCDEPNSGLDPINSAVIDELLLNLTKEIKSTTLINTHDLNTVLEYGENIFFLNEGKLFWQGNKDEILYSNVKEVKEFLFVNKKIQEAFYK